MSSSPTVPASTTASSTSSPSPPEGSADDRARPVRTAIIACGAIGGEVREISRRRGWETEVHGLPAIYHNEPRRIVAAVSDLAAELTGRGLRVVVAYADCGTYGALDEVCDRLGLARLRGLHCYDVFGGADRIGELFEAEPGTYLLTDFLIRSFRRSVLGSLGLTEHPELWPDYFGHYRRLVWLAQAPDPDLAERAAEIAAMFGLPLTVIETGTTGLERELELLLSDQPVMTARNVS